MGGLKKGKVAKTLQTVMFMLKTSQSQKCAPNLSCHDYIERMFLNCKSTSVVR